MPPLDIAFYFLIVVAIWWVPGWLFGEALRVPRFLLPALAPAIGAGLLTALGLWLTPLGYPWTRSRTALAAVVVIVLFAIAHYLIKRYLPRTSKKPAKPRIGWSVERADSQWFGFRPRDIAIIGIPTLIGGIIAGIVWLHSTQDLVRIHQDYDFPFHSNMTRLVAESQQWNLGFAGMLNYYDGNIAEAPYQTYPIAFHGMAALGWPTSGTEVTIWLNAVVFTLLVLQVPLAAVAMAMLITRNPYVLGLAGLLSAMPGMFPYEPLFRGPLLSFFAGLILLGPFLLWLTIAVHNRRYFWIPALGMGALGMLASQASVVIVAAFVLIPWFLSYILPRKNRPILLPSLLYIVYFGVAAVVISFPVLIDMVQQLGRVTSIRWASVTSEAGALGNLITFGTGPGGPQYVLAALFIIGIAVLIGRKKDLWYLVPMVITAVLYINLAGTDSDSLSALTGLFYGDSWRLSAIMGLFLVPLMALGTWFLYEKAMAWLKSFRTETPRTFSGRTEVISLVGLLAVLLVVSGLGYVQRNQGLTSLGFDYKFEKSGIPADPVNDGLGPWTLSDSQRDFFKNISTWVGPEDNVLNNVCDGSTYMYALGGRPAVIRNFEAYPTNDQYLLLNRFNQIDQDPSVAKAAARLGVTHVYVGRGMIREWNSIPYGLRGLDKADYLTVDTSFDDGILYRVNWDKIPDGDKIWEKYKDTRTGLDNVAGMWGTTEPSVIREVTMAC